MSLSSELAALRAQQRREIIRLRYSYARTKRDLQRKYAPDRVIRRHMGASLGIAAALGFLLAPGIGGANSAKPKKSRRFLQHLTTPLMRSARRIFATANGSASGPATSQGTAEKPQEDRSLLALLLGTILSRIDFARIITVLITSLREKFAAAEPASESNGHHADISIADAGTVQPPDWEQDFQ